jgi:hypothetical protein
LFPAPDGYSKIDIDGRATGPKAMHVHQNEIPRRGACHEVRAIERVRDRVQSP